MLIKCLWRKNKWNLDFRWVSSRKRSLVVAAQEAPVSQLFAAGSMAKNVQLYNCCFFPDLTSTFYTAADDVWLSIVLPLWLKCLPFPTALTIAQIRSEICVHWVSVVSMKEKFYYWAYQIPLPLLSFCSYKRSWAFVQCQHYSSQVHIQPWLKPIFLKV